MEKLSSETMRQHGVALRRDVGVDAFHVVDLVAEIGVEDRGAVDHGAGRQRVSAMRRMRMPRPPSQENFRSSTRRSPDGSSTASLTSKFSAAAKAELARRLAADQEAR